jgi:hypothetical protein
MTMLERRTETGRLTTTSGRPKHDSVALVVDEGGQGELAGHERLLLFNLLVLACVASVFAGYDRAPAVRALTDHVVLASNDRSRISTNDDRNGDADGIGKVHTTIWGIQLEWLDFRRRYSLPPIA